MVGWRLLAMGGMRALENLSRKHNTVFYIPPDYKYPVQMELE